MTTRLNQPQLQRVQEAMHAYFSAPTYDGESVASIENRLNKNRLSVIDNELGPLLKNYVRGQVPVEQFKSTVDGINKRNKLWGFNGTKGQMFFNLILNVAENKTECDQQIKAGLSAPPNEIVAAQKIGTFTEYVKKIADRHVASGGSKHAKPNASSVPFFLSYFWQVQQPDVWPIYYTNTVNVLNDLNLWQPKGDAATDYVEYKEVHDELVEFLSREIKRDISLYDVEHIFWFHAGNMPGETDYQKQRSKMAIIHTAVETDMNKQILIALPDSYIPPIVAIIPNIARNEIAVREAAKTSGISLERALEKSVDAAWAILGYETLLLGQGKGRVPDGLAVSRDDSYALLWDAKVRFEPYIMGTDDRAIKEYIVTQSRELKRKRSFRNIYYLIISSQFSDDYDDPIRSLKMETDVNEVGLVEADALVAMVDAKMRHPQEVTLGPDGLQRCFSGSGVLSAQLVRETLL